MIQVGDKVVVIRPEPHNIPAGYVLQGTGKVGKVGIVREIILNRKEFGGISNIYSIANVYRAGSYWFLECEIELLEPKCILPDGVFRCKCGATTTRKEGYCCDCVNK